MCPGGSVPDPDPFTKCIKVINCTVDNECPGNSVCGNQNRCFCPEPNVGDDCRRKNIFEFFYYVVKYVLNI